MSQVHTIKLDRIVLDHTTQPRASIDSATVTEYAESLTNGANGFPAIDVFRDESDPKILRCADGFHRVNAYRQAGLTEIEATVHKGTLRDAVLFAVSANQNHGLRRSNADKRRAVTILLEDEEWRAWSDHKIAEQCGVSQQFVTTVRTQLYPPSLTTVVSQPRIGKDGRITKTANINKSRTRINGTDAEDPPDIAKARANGRIPENAVVEVEEPDEPTTLEEVMDDCVERKAIADDIPDEEWLDSLPLAGKLSTQCQKVHDNDAIRWRHSAQARNHFKHQVARLLPKTIAIVGAYSALLRQFVVINGPERWRICPTPENGGCNGVGTNALGTCHRCHGRGYWIP